MNDAEQSPAGSGREAPRRKRTQKTAKKPTSRKKGQRSTTTAGTPTPKARKTRRESPDGPPPVVGVGASAGGLAAIEELLDALPKDERPDIAFVVVQHLDPEHKSILTDLVARHTGLEVHTVEDGMPVQPGHVYIIPPNKDMAILNGVLQLVAPETPRGVRLPIDFFFRSLAGDQHDKAICIVLSGTGTDGTLGLKAVKGEGGMTMVQEPASAAYDGMPRSAISTGLVDFVLEPKEMPDHLLAYLDRTRGRCGGLEGPPPTTPERAIDKVLILLRAQTGHDFSQYKKNTIGRRIERRMVVTQIDSIDEYLQHLRKTPLEVDTLFREMLIGVTTFFRDPEAFEALGREALTPLLNERSAGEQLRIWVPGCSTGEEAYSIAISLLELAEEGRTPHDACIFATDIDEVAIERARTGEYPESIAADVSEERLQRFFTHDGDVFRVSRSVRDLLVFAEQDVTKDPPFSRLDLVSCRNLLIYMQTDLQRRLLPLFHYALRPEGYLFLGTSETIGESRDLFSVVDKKHRLYRRRSGVASQATIPAGPVEPGAPGRRRAPSADVAGTPMHVRELAERTLLNEVAPPCVIVNREADVLYVHGSTGRYLEPATGEANLNLLRMAREGLRLELTTALRKATSQHAGIRREGIPVRSNGERSLVNLVVRPLEEAGDGGLFMVLFEPATLPEPASTTRPADEGGAAEERIAALERELGAKEEYLQSTVEELETSNEELKSTNEELQSANEELQSTNEELETSKEELQSVNEELVTVNTELQQKIEDLSRVNNDMSNLLAGTGIGTIFVDQQLRILRFTPAATEVISLIKTDIGRPVSDLASRLQEYDTLTEDVTEVLKTLQPRQAEIQSTTSDWYLMRIQPYRTLENVIEGAVLTFVDITEQKRIQERLHEVAQAAEEAELYAQSVLDSVNDPLLLIDGDLKTMSANAAFYEQFQTTKDATIDISLDRLAEGFFRKPGLPSVIESVFSDSSAAGDLDIHVEPSDDGGSFKVEAAEVRQPETDQRLIMLRFKRRTD